MVGGAIARGEVVVPWWQSECGRFTLYCGDCLDVLPQLRAASVSLVLADPPYGINTKSDGMGKINPWADLCNAAYWYAAWLRECKRVVADWGCVWSFLNWRSLTTFQRASCDLGWPIESLLVWDKEWIGPGGVKGLRPSYELVALWAMPDFSINDRGLADVQRFKWSGYKPNGHPAEKPPALCEWLIQECASPHMNSSKMGDAVVLDPFTGSGTTGVACAKTGRRFIGIEIDERYCGIAKRRILEALEGEALFRQPGATEADKPLFADADGA